MPNYNIESKKKMSDLLFRNHGKKRKFRCGQLRVKDCEILDGHSGSHRAERIFLGRESSLLLTMHIFVSIFANSWSQLFGTMCYSADCHYSYIPRMSSPNLQQSVRLHGGPLLVFIYNGFSRKYLGGGHWLNYNQ